MVGDPYEEANQQQQPADEAKLVTPSPAKKSRKIVMAGLVAAGLFIGLVILANVAALVTGRNRQDARPVPKPTTMSAQQSARFAQQQSDQADYMRGMDRNKQQQNHEDQVLGNADNLASDPYDEAEGVPRKTEAQDDAEHGRGSSGQASKSAAQLERERAVSEAQHRRQNDLDASASSVDFSDYFEKEKAPAAKTEVAGPTPTVESDAAALQAKAAAVEAQTNTAAKRHTPLTDPEADETSAEKPASLRQAHDPKEDYAFDSFSGKLYRLMEDTILETVLVNRLNGASIGPVICMVTEHVYSESGRLLIPKGTRLLGSVASVGNVNQERLFVAFHRMIMPDGYSVSLDKFQGLDVVGQTGLRDLVNHHYLQIFGASLALAAVSATTQINTTGGAYGSYDWGVSMRVGASQQLGQSAQRVMERFLNILPTFTIRERARVKIMLSADLLLPDLKNHTMDPDL